MLFAWSALQGTSHHHETRLEGSICACVPAHVQKYAGLLYDVSAGGAPLKEAAISTAKSAGIDLEKVS